MRKSSVSLKQTIDHSVEILHAKLPDAALEVTMSPEPGVDAWIWILIDAAKTDEFTQIRALARRSLADSLEESNFNIIPIVDQKEPVHG